MGLFHWDAYKNDKLIRERGISFEEVLLAIEQGRLLGEEIFLKTIIPSRKLTKQYLGQGGTQDV